MFLWLGKRVLSCRLTSNSVCIGCSFSLGPRCACSTRFGWQFGHWKFGCGHQVVFWRLWMSGQCSFLPFGFPLWLLHDKLGCLSGIFLPEGRVCWPGSSRHVLQACVWLKNVRFYWRWCLVLTKAQLGFSMPLFSPSFCISNLNSWAFGETIV